MKVSYDLVLLENCSLLAASTRASTQTKPRSTQVIETPVQQALDKGTSTTLEHESKPAKLTGQFQLKFKEKVKSRGRHKRTLKQLCSFNKTDVDRATRKQHGSEPPSKNRKQIILREAHMSNCLICHSSVSKADKTTFIACCSREVHEEFYTMDGCSNCDK